MALIFMAAYTNYRRDPRVKREAEALVELGHEVVFLARRQQGEPNRETIAGVKVIKAMVFKSRCVSFSEYIIDYLVFLAVLLSHLLIHPRRYKCIHINNMPDFLVFAAWLPRLLGVPVIHDIHDLMPELYAEKFSSGEKHWVSRVLKIQERWAGNFASKVITVEDRLKDILIARGIPRDKLHVLMNLPDDRIFQPRNMPPAKAIGSPIILAYHGTLARRLGLDLAIDAIAKVRSRGYLVELRILGAGEEREALIQQCDQLGLSPFVTFSEGFVPVESVPALLQDVDVGIIPLRACSGTDIMLPTKLLEYVTMGIPCIVPRTGTISRYFDEDMVRYFDAEDVESLSDAIIDLCQNESKRSGLAHNATERFGSIFRWSVHRKIYTNLVEQLLVK